MVDTASGKCVTANVRSTQVYWIMGYSIPYFGNGIPCIQKILQFTIEILYTLLHK